MYFFFWGEAREKHTHTPKHESWSPPQKKLYDCKLSKPAPKPS